MYIYICPISNRSIRTKGISGWESNEQNQTPGDILSVFTYVTLPLYFLRCEERNYNTSLPTYLLTYISPFD